MTRLAMQLAVVLAAVAPLLAGPTDAAPAGKRRQRGFVATTPHEPIVLRAVSGRRLFALRIAREPSITLEDCRDIDIVACDVRSIRIVNCNGVRVLHSFIHDGAAVGVTIESSSNVLVQGNRIERVASGVYALDSRGVRVVGNFCADVQGPMPRGQMVQFDKVSGPGNVISDNHAINRHGRSRPEDVISIYMSQGTAASPILITRNHLRGDPQLGSQDKSDSGSGIMLGDGGGQWIHCVGNTIVDAGAVGIGVAGGSRITVAQNTVIGRVSNVANVGIYVWNQSGEPGGPVTVADNAVAWFNAGKQPNPWWEGGGFERIDLRTNRFDLRSLLDATPRPPAPAPWPPLPRGRNPLFPWRE